MTLKISLLTITAILTSACTTPNSSSGNTDSSGGRVASGLTPVIDGPYTPSKPDLDDPVKQKKLDDLRERNPEDEAEMSFAKGQLHLFYWQNFVKSYPGLELEKGLELARKYGEKNADNLTGPSDPDNPDNELIFDRARESFASRYNRKMADLIKKYR